MSMSAPASRAIVKAAAVAACAITFFPARCAAPTSAVSVGRSGPPSPGDLGDDLDVVGALGDTGVDESPSLFGSGDDRVGGNEPGMGTCGADRRQAGAAKVREPAASRDLAQSCELLGRPRCHVQAGGRTVPGELLQGVGVVQMDVRVDQPGKHGGAATIDLDIAGSACACACGSGGRDGDDPVGVEGDVHGEGTQFLAVEDTDSGDAGAGCHRPVSSQW
ncbi:hypothetical protein [Rhodococcus opacus]|uniref:hypothetical protein n=1 Tax=Rhodococcus opacus TaxID=37919 RepID=UPI001CEDE239|nr:hypothetical protein [Rhodococcus opacus]